MHILNHATNLSVTITNWEIAAMGEVRVKVHIANLFDEEKLAEGDLAADQVRTYDADATVDTGAVATVVPIHVVEKLGIRIRRKSVVQYADGRNDVVGMTAPMRFEIMGRDTADEALVLGDEVLIGQTVLEKLDLLVDCANRRLVPNPAHPDQPVLKIK